MAMRLKARHLSAVALATLTAACGTGGGGGGVVVTPPPITGPTPTPTPGPANANLIDTLVTESFSNVASTGSASYPISGATPSFSASSAAATIRYDATTGGYTLTVGGRSQTFLPAHLDSNQSNALITVFVRTNGDTTDSLTITKPGTSGRLTYKYVGAAFWQRTVQGAATITGNFDAIAYGVRSPDAAVPRTGTGHYDLGMLGVVTTPGSVEGISGEGTLQTDFASGGIAVNIAMPSGWGGTWQGTGRISSSSNNFSGNFGSSYQSNQFSGQFQGAFFGPGAEELGATFNGRSPGLGNVMVGAFMGRRASGAINSDFLTLSVPQFFTAGTSRVSFDKTGDNTPAANVTLGQSSFVMGYDPIDGGLLNFFFSDNIYRRRNTANQYGLSGVIGSYAGYRTAFGTPAWIQYNDGSLKYLRAGRFLTIVGNRHVYDDFVLGFGTAPSGLPTGRAGYQLGLTATAFTGSQTPQPLVGQGALTVDFATGQLSAAGDIRDLSTNTFFAGFEGSAQLAASSSNFSGNWKVDGAAAYTGNWSGGFFGPQGQEVGARFGAAAANGDVVSGAVYGGRNDAALPADTPLANLTTETVLGAMAGFVSQDRSNNYTHNLDSQVSVTFNPTTGRYAFKSSNTTNLGAPPIEVVFEAADLVAGAGTDSFSVYRSADGSREARILKFAGTNRELQLTYASFATIIHRHEADNRQLVTEYFVPFGAVTPPLQVPRSGSATYSGRVYASGYVHGIGTTARVNGSLAATMNFGNGEFSALLNLIASDPAGVIANRALGEYLLSGHGGANGFMGTRPGGPTYTYAFQGAFFGPAAAELGASFVMRRDGLTAGVWDDFNIAGAFIGKKD